MGSNENVWLATIPRSAASAARLTPAGTARANEEKPMPVPVNSSGYAGSMYHLSLDATLENATHSTAAQANVKSAASIAGDRGRPGRGAARRSQSIASAAVIAAISHAPR